MLPERRHVFQRSGGQRVERRKPKPQCEVDRRPLEPNGELMVVDHLKPGHRGRRRGRCGDLVETGDRAEKALLQLGVGGQRAVIPGVDERVRGDRRAVAERPAGFERDPVIDVVGGLDRLGHLQRRCALGVIRHQAGEQPVDDPAAVGVVGIGRDQRILRLARIDDHHIGTDGRAPRSRSATRQPAARPAQGRETDASRPPPISNTIRAWLCRVGATVLSAAARRSPAIAHGPAIC